MISPGEQLERLRIAFKGITSVREIKMFGGIAFLVNEHMTVALSPRGLLVRVGPDAHEDALANPGTRAMQMRGRVMTGYVYVDPAPNGARMIRSWVQRALRHNRTLPPKKTTRRVPRKRQA